MMSHGKPDGQFQSDKSLVAQASRLCWRRLKPAATFFISHFWGRMQNASRTLLGFRGIIKRFNIPLPPFRKGGDSSPLIAIAKSFLRLAILS
jgi:hypothetical protein